MPVATNVLQPGHEPHLPREPLAWLPHGPRGVRNVRPPVAAAPKVDLLLRLPRVQLRLKVARTPLVPELERPKLNQEALAGKEKRVTRHHPRTLAPTATGALQPNEVLNAPQRSGAAQLTEPTLEPPHVEQLRPPLREPAGGPQVLVLPP